MLRDKDNFDERQVQVLGRIYKYTLNFALFAILANGFINAYGFVWASALYQNLLIAMLITSVLTIQCIIREVVLGKKKGRMVIIMIVGGSIGGLIGGILGYFALLPDKDIVVVGVYEPERFSMISSGMLTEAGGGIIIFAMIIINVLVAVIKFIHHKKLNKSKGE